MASASFSFGPAFHFSIFPTYREAAKAAANMLVPEIPGDLQFGGFCEMADNETG